MAPADAAVRAMAVNVSNALAFREVLDGICGPEEAEGVRSNTMPVALKMFETGALPHPPRDATEGAAPRCWTGAF